MLEQHEALSILEGAEIVSVKVTEDDNQLHSFEITTVEGEVIVVCVFLNYLRVEQFTPSEVENMEW